MNFGSRKSLNKIDYVLDPTNEVYTLAQELVFSGAYHRPTCGSGPSRGDIA